MFLLQRDRHIKQRVLVTVPDIASPTPTLIPPGPIQTEVMNSPDGTKTLTMKKQEISGKVKYSFFIDKLIFEKEEVLQSLLIPYNTWSPDNIFVFIKETGPINNYYVMYVSGSLFPNNSSFINVQDLFLEKVPGFIIEEITGWAAPNLLIVNTVATDGSKVSFWFDVPSQSFIQLGTYFK